MFNRSSKKDPTNITKLVSLGASIHDHDRQGNTLLDLVRAHSSTTVIIKCLTFEDYAWTQPYPEYMIVPTGITTLDSSVFLDCHHLIFVVCPISVKHIGRYAFLRCSRLRLLVLPQALTEDQNLIYDIGVNFEHTIIMSLEQYAHTFNHVLHLHYSRLSAEAIASYAPKHPKYWSPAIMSGWIGWRSEV